MPAKPTTAAKPKTQKSNANASGKGKQPAASAPGGRKREPCLIVGYDGSPEARHAAVWAARRAAPNGMLVLIHASRPPHRWPALQIVHMAIEQVLQIAGVRGDRGRALIDELFMDGDEALLDVSIEAHVVDRPPAQALIEAARSHHASEIIVGSHHSSRTDAVYGDVAAELTRTAPVPVCVVPLGEEPAAEGARAPSAGA